MPKILVIDDDTIVRQSIIHLLEDEGYQISSANDGKRGMVMFRSGQPDLVITDIIMPEQECMQTIAEILKAAPNAKIIAISGIGRTLIFSRWRKLPGQPTPLRSPSITKSC